MASDSAVLEKLRVKPFAVVGHRGAAGLAAENSLRALREAIRVGADIAEFDMQATSDGVVVASHDPVVVADNGLKIGLRRASYEELRRITVRGEPIARLEELLAEAVGKIPLFLEVKEPRDTRLVVDVVRREGALGWIAIISFYDEALRIARSLEPRIPLGLVYYKPPGRLFEAKKLGCRIVLPRYSIATSKAVSLAKRLKLYTVAWTVNDEKWFVELWKRGVDGIATDRPDLGSKIKSRIASRERSLEG